MEVGGAGRRMTIGSRVSKLLRAAENNRGGIFGQPGLSGKKKSHEQQLRQESAVFIVHIVDVAHCCTATSQQTKYFLAN